MGGVRRVRQGVRKADVLSLGYLALNCFRYH
jgi:hypothetical protein